MDFLAIAYAAVLPLFFLCYVRDMCPCIGAKLAALLLERVIFIFTKLKNCCEQDPSRFISYLLWGICASLILFSFLTASPVEIILGIGKIICHPAGLIADNIAIAGIGATFFNSGMLMAVALIMFRINKVPITGPGIACILLVAGFSMFGKDIANIWPIIFGVFLYAKHEHAPFSRYIYIALYGTALSPLITELALLTDNFFLSFLLICAAGLMIGFILAPLSNYCLRVHQGYNLYNVGFSAGLVGTLLVALLRSFGYSPESQMVWCDVNHPSILIYLYALFCLLLLLGLCLCGWKLEPYRRLYRHSGRLMSDFVLMDGVPVVLMNMGILGIFSTSYVLAVGGPLNGATIGGIFTIVGFSAFGKHIKNIVPIIAGVVLGSIVKVWEINAPSVLLAALFGTSLAPISGQFGWIAGITAGFLHSSMVLSIGAFHGGLNLYNNGFSAGLVALILVPLIESIEGDKKNASH